MKWWCYAVGPSVNISLKVLVQLSSNFTHNTSRGSSCAFWGIWTLIYFCFRTMTYLDVFTHTLFPEEISKSTGPITYCTFMFSKVPSCAFSGFWSLTLKLPQQFDLIYDIGKSDWNIFAEYQQNCSRWLDHYYKTKCEISGEDAFWKI